MAIGSIDVFGWSADMLSLVVNVPATPNCPTPLQVHEKFIKMLSYTSALPDALSYFLAAGSYTPLNKVPAAENAMKVAAGEDPSLRPVNSGSMPLAHLGNNVLKSEHGKAATRLTEPNQKGFMKDGCGRAIHAMRGAYNARKAGLSLDGMNSYNAIHRDCVVNAAKHLWPKASPFVDKFYDQPFPVMYLYRGEDGHFYIDIQHSWEGVKQGDTVSSLLFALAAHMYIYEPLGLAFPMLSSHVKNYDIDQIIIIDDFSAIIECPQAGASTAEWSQWYKQVALYIHSFDLVANPHGIYRNPTKDKLLIHADLNPPAPPPTGPDTYGIDLASIITTDGIVLAGAPIGTDEFMNAFAHTKANLANDKTSKIAALCPDNVQVALAMISTSSSKSLDYLVRQTPTMPIAEALLAFDGHTLDTVLNIICPVRSQRNCPSRLLTGPTLFLRSPLNTMVLISSRLLRKDRWRSSQVLLLLVQTLTSSNTRIILILMYVTPVISTFITPVSMSTSGLQFHRLLLLIILSY